jgi:hypothetical protein
MKLILLFATLIGLAFPQTPKPQNVVIIETDLGEIQVQLNPEKAPRTVENFLKYVDQGHYTGGRFHRTVTMQNQPDKKIKIEVIQAGVNPAKEKADFPAVKLERTGIRASGISMARFRWLETGPIPQLPTFSSVSASNRSLILVGNETLTGRGLPLLGK